jgi:molybdopterin synthase catalytic subunit/sulfur carrier protein ThiS
MRVRVLFFGVLKDTTLGDVFETYAERFATLKDRRSSILFARNREFSKPDTMLSDNDEVAFLPPVSGGSGDLRHEEGGHIFAITHDLLNSRALADSLKRPEDGAVVIFEGVVRNNTRGRATSYLEYECYPEMALPQMVKIGREIATGSRIGRIGMMHRLGRLEIGEASVAVAVTAPHRRAAFEAALEGIDRLKREVPIWKKEVFADGAEWVEGEWGENLRSHLMTK